MNKPTTLLLMVCILCGSLSLLLSILVKDLLLSTIFMLITLPFLVLVIISLIKYSRNPAFNTTATIWVCNSSNDTPFKLERLQDLYKKRALTDEEYQATKNRLLPHMPSPITETYIQIFGVFPADIHSPSKSQQPVYMSMTTAALIFDNTFRIPYSRIQTVTVFDSFGERIFSSGKITRKRWMNLLTMRGETSMSRFVLTYRNDAFRETTLAFEMQRAGIGLHAANIPRMQMAILMQKYNLFSQFVQKATCDTLDKLEQLHLDHDSGKISAECFTQQKEQLLQKL